MSIYEMLYPWQKNLINKFKHKKSYGLFLDCGLGKTPISLAFAEQNQCKKIIVITINGKAIEKENISGSWFWWAKKSNINYNLLNKKDEDFDNEFPEILLINYESLYKRNNKKSGLELRDNVKSFIKSCTGKNTAIIVDESHKMKDLQSMQTKSIFKIQSLLKIYAKEVYTYLLTGTPFTQGYIDLYTQLKFLGCQMNKTQFIDNFCVRGNIPGLLGWQQPIISYKNLDKLYELIHKYAITIKSEEVEDLPEKINIYYSTPMSEAFKMFIQEKAKGTDIINYAKKNNIEIDESFYNVDKRVNNPFYSNIDYPKEDYLCETSGSFWLRARQLSIGFQGNSEKSTWYDRTRLNDLRKFLEQHEDNYLLFYNYVPELLEIYQICEELGYNIDVYCGECKSLLFYDKYSSQSEEERLTNKKNIIIANFASGSTGFNWQIYYKCILFSVPLYKDYEQGIKRLHRLGQKNNVIYYHFYQNNWLDKSMKESLNNNIQYSEDMFKSDLKKIQELLDKEN